MQHFPPEAVLAIEGITTFSEAIAITHGRIEQRRIIACPMPPMHGWESIMQCFAITRTRINKKTDKESTEVAYGITSLPPEKTDAQQLLAYNRGHWHIENKLHWQRDTSFKEDDSTLRSHTAQTINAACNSLVILLLKHAGFPSITQALETCADDKSIPLNLLC